MLLSISRVARRICDVRTAWLNLVLAAGDVFPTYARGRYQGPGGSDMRTKSIGATISLGLLAAGCAWEGPSLGGYPGAQFAVTSYYVDNAIEKNMSCTRPAMTPVRADVISDDGKQVKMLVRYSWRSDSMQSRTTMKSGQGRSSSNMGYCNGWDERTFTLVRGTDGRLAVASMTGPQRGHAGSG